MDNEQYTGTHSAEAAALGFYYQAFFALLMLIEQNTDNATIGIEQLDDIELNADGQKLLFQLKHSIKDDPPPINLKSRALWRTIKVWVDILPTLNLSETTLYLVTVGRIPKNSPLNALTACDTDRAELVQAMVDEARRVIEARVAAAKIKKSLPYSDRIDGCDAFLALTDTDRSNLMRRTFIRQDSPPIAEIEDRIREHQHLKILPSDQRPLVVERLVEWWDRQIVYSMCSKRDRVISRTELQYQISAIVGDIERDKLVSDFETVSPPDDYQPDGMLARQIRLVEGKTSDLSNAIREEWKAREQRSKWLNANPGMALTINDYDLILKEHWSDRHCRMIEDCVDSDHKIKCTSGLNILRWTHDEAPRVVRPIGKEWNAAYYVRGSYQVLAINLKVGWHPEYVKLLESGE